MNGPRRIVLTLVLAAAALACQCSGEERFQLEPVDPGRPQGLYRGLCVEAAQRMCEASARCEAESAIRDDHPNWFKLWWLNEEQCVARKTLECELKAEDTTYSVSGQKIAKCTLELNSRCDERDERADLIDCLGRDTRGSIVQGGVCFDEKSCTTGKCMPNAQRAAFQCGTCELDCVPPCDKAGEFCAQDLVKRKSYCRTDDPEGTPCGQEGMRDCGQRTFCSEGFCRRGRELGEPCDPVTAPCLNGEAAYCDLSQRICSKRADIGELCDENGVKAPPCHGWYAHCPSSGRCRAYKTAWYGEPCGVMDQDRIWCLGYAGCTATRSRPEGRCVAPAEDGRLCDPNQRLDCLPPARCIGGFCRYPKLAYCEAVPLQVGNR